MVSLFLIVIFCALFNGAFVLLIRFLQKNCEDFSLTQHVGTDLYLSFSLAEDRIQHQSSRRERFHLLWLRNRHRSLDMVEC